MSVSLVLAVLLVASVPMPQAPQPSATVKAPDTPAGRALTEFVTSFNKGGEARRVWLEGRTTIDAEARAGILQQDAAFLEEHGPVTIVRIAEASEAQVAAVIRHEKSGAHGHLTIAVEAAAPFKVSNMQLRAATPEEIKGGV